MRRQVVILSGLMLVSAAAVAWAFNDESTERKALDKILVAWTEHFNNHDAKALSMLYSVDADSVFGRKDIIRGRAAIEKYFADFFSKNPQVKTKQRALRRRFVAPTIVVEDGEWSESGHTEKNLPTAGRWVAVLSKKDGRWQVICDRGFTPAPEPAE